MGAWAKAAFGREKFDSVGFILAGKIRPRFESKVLGLFDRVISSNDLAYHCHLAEKDGHCYPVLTNVYGGPALLDSLAELHDGGCRNVIFVGYAYAGFKRSLSIGSVVVPIEAYHFDYLHGQSSPTSVASVPDRELRARIMAVLDKGRIEYLEGKDITVPAVTFQLPHNNARYKRINPITLEMELASCFSRAGEIGMRSAGILVVGDNRSFSILDGTKHKLRSAAKLRVLKALISNLREFDLPDLKVKRKFDVSEYLAGIIENPEDATNIYRENTD